MERFDGIKMFTVLPSYNFFSVQNLIIFSMESEDFANKKFFWYVAGCTLMILEFEISLLIMKSMDQ